MTHGNRIEKALVKETTSGEEHSIYPSYVINATGAWVNTILGLANLRLEMALSKGSMLITNQRLSQRVINRCRKPSDGDIVVPNDTVSILGTTSVHIDQVEAFEVTPAEVSLLIQETKRMIPDIGKTRFIRAYAGIRPLAQSTGKGDDRAISRGFMLIDHREKDGLHNLIMISGGKFVTYRLMAERTVDLICNKMGIQVPCSTHLKPLPGANESKGLRGRFRKFFQDRGEILCDCELVQRKEVDDFLREGKIKNLQDILHRTRLGKGTCQGGFCAFRLLGGLLESGVAKGDSNDVLKKFLEERWRGRRPIPGARP